MVDFTACEEEYRKACERYAIVEPDAAAVNRRWRIFLAVEAVLLACFVGLLLFARGFQLTPVATAILGMWLVCSLPVAVLYLLGKPMTLDGGWPSARSRAMARDIGRRAPLSDEEFYSRFYKVSGIQRETIARIRLYLRKSIDDVSDRCVPTDYLPLLWDDLDFADIFYALGRELGIELWDCEGTFNGTLDGLIRHVISQIDPAPAFGRDGRT